MRRNFDVRDKGGDSESWRPDADIWSPPANTFGASALFSGGGAADHWQPSHEWFAGDQSCSSFFWRPAFPLPQSHLTTSQFPAPRAFAADTDSSSASAIAASSARLHEQRAVTTTTVTAKRTRESDRESDEQQDNDWAQQTLQQSVEQTQTEPVGAKQSPPASATGSSVEDAGDGEWDEWASLGLLDALDDPDENDEDDCAKDESTMFVLSLSRSLGALSPGPLAMRSLTDPALSLASGCGSGAGLLGPPLCPHSHLDPLPLESSLPFGRLLGEALSPSLSLSSSSSAGGTLGASAGCSSPSSGLGSLDTSPAQFDAHSRRSRFWDWAPFDLPDALAPDPFHSAHSWTSDQFHPHPHSLRSTIAPSHTDKSQWATTNTTTNNRHTASPHSSSVSSTSIPPPSPPPYGQATVPKAAAAQQSLQSLPVSASASASASSGSTSTTTTTAGAVPRKRLVNVFVHTESPLARLAGPHEHTCQQAAAGKEAQRSKSAHTITPLSEQKKVKPWQVDEVKNEEKHEGNDAASREAQKNKEAALTVSALPVLCIGPVEKFEGSVNATNASVQAKDLTADVLVCEPYQYQRAELCRDFVGCPMIRISTSDAPSACVMESSTVAKSTERSQNISTTSGTAQCSTASSFLVPSASAHQLTLGDCPKLLLRQPPSTGSQSAASSSSASSTTTSSSSAVNTEELRERLASVLAGAPLLLATSTATSAVAANEEEAQAHAWGTEWQRRAQTQEQQQEGQNAPAPNPLRKGTAAEIALYECCLQLNTLHLDALAVCTRALYSSLLHYKRDA